MSLIYMENEHCGMCTVLATFNDLLRTSTSQLLFLKFQVFVVPYVWVRVQLYMMTRLNLLLIKSIYSFFISIASHLLPLISSAKEKVTRITRHK